MSKKANRFSTKCVVRIVQEHRGEYASLWAAIRKAKRIDDAFDAER